MSDSRSSTLPSILVFRQEMECCTLLPVRLEDNKRPSWTDCRSTADLRQRPHSRRRVASTDATKNRVDFYSFRITSNVVTGGRVQASIVFTQGSTREEGSCRKKRVCESQLLLD